MIANAQTEELAETIADEPTMNFPESLKMWGDNQPEDAFSRAAATTIEQFVDTQKGSTGKASSREPYISLWDLTKVDRLKGMIAHAMREMVAWSGGKGVDLIHRMVVAESIEDRRTMTDSDRRKRDRQRNRIFPSNGKLTRKDLVRLLGDAMAWQDVETRRVVKRELTEGNG